MRRPAAGIVPWTFDQEDAVAKWSYFKDNVTAARKYVKEQHMLGEAPRMENPFVDGRIWVIVKFSQNQAKSLRMGVGTSLWPRGVK